jgi:hypothetical protein
MVLEDAFFPLPDFRDLAVIASDKAFNSAQRMHRPCMPHADRVF